MPNELGTHGFEFDIDVPATADELHRSWTQGEEMEWLAAGTEGIYSQPVTADARPGGQWRVLMVETPEKKYYTGGVYESVEPASVSFRWGAPDGWPVVDPDDLSASPLITVSWAEQGEGSRMRLALSVEPDAPESTREQVVCDPCRQGWMATVSRLQEKFTQSG